MKKNRTPAPVVAERPHSADKSKMGAPAWPLIQVLHTHEIGASTLQILERMLARNGGLNGQPDALLAAFNQLTKGVNRMANEIENLTTEVKRSTTVRESVRVLLVALAKRLLDNAGDPAAIRALATELRDNNDAVTADVVANTPVADEPIPGV